MKAYPAYKASGIEWLGDIPAHWEMVRLKHLLLDGNDGIKIGPFGSSLKSDIIKEEGFKVYGQENVIKNDFTAGHRYIDDDKFLELNVYELFSGDIVITMMGTMGKSKVVPQNIEKGIMDSHLIRIRVNPAYFNPELISLLINDSNYIFTQTKLQSRGSIMEGLNSSIIKSLLFLVPPPDEQKQILDFVYHKTRLIDTYIAKKQQQVERWQAYRAALINQAVTKGLNPAAPMKASGIEWLGDIPAHWERAKLKHIANFKSGDSITATDINETGYFPVYGGNGIRGYTDRFTHNGNFILIGRQGALCGNIHYAKGCFWASEHAIIVYLQTDYEQVWFGELLRAMNLNQYSLAAAQPGLAVETIRNLIIPIPPKVEQQNIASYIKKQTTKIDTLVAATQRQLERLHAYRTALISDVVTGKLDVRNTAGASCRLNGNNVS